MVTQGMYTDGSNFKFNVYSNKKGNPIFRHPNISKGATSESKEKKTLVLTQPAAVEHSALHYMKGLSLINKPVEALDFFQDLTAGDYEVKHGMCHLNLAIKTKTIDECGWIQKMAINKNKFGGLKTFDGKIA